MATSKIRSKHFAGFNNSGHHTPEQFRAIVQFLLEHPDTITMNSSSMYAGTGGRPVWRQVRNSTGLVLTMQSRGLRQTYVLFSDNPERVAASLHEEFDFEPLPVVVEVVEPEAPTGQDLPALTVDGDVAAGHLDRAVMQAFMTLARSNTGSVPRDWNGHDALDAITDAISEYRSRVEVNAEISRLASVGRIHISDDELHVTVPLDNDGQLLLPIILPSVDVMLAQDPPVADVTVYADDEAAAETLNVWASRQEQHYLDAGCPAYLRPFLHGGLLDAATRWFTQALTDAQQDEADTVDRTGGWSLEDVRAALRHAPEVLAAAVKTQAVTAASLTVADLSVTALEAQAQQLRIALDEQEQYRDVLAIMKDAAGHLTTEGARR